MSVIIYSLMYNSTEKISRSIPPKPKNESSTCDLLNHNIPNNQALDTNKVDFTDDHRTRQL